MKDKKFSTRTSIAGYSLIAALAGTIAINPFDSSVTRTEQVYKTGTTEVARETEWNYDFSGNPVITSRDTSLPIGNHNYWSGLEDAGKQKAQLDRRCEAYKDNNLGRCIGEDK